MNHKAETVQSNVTHMRAWSRAKVTLHPTLLNRLAREKRGQLGLTDNSVPSARSAFWLALVLGALVGVPVACYIATRDTSALVQHMLDLAR